MSDLVERQVQRELRNLDPDLFLDKRWENGVLVYLVRYFIGSAEEPLDTVKWVDPSGRPLPLSLGIVDRVKMQEGDLREAIQRATLYNIAEKERRKQAVNEELDAIISEHQAENRKGKTSSGGPGRLIGEFPDPWRRQAR